MAISLITIRHSPLPGAPPGIITVVAPNFFLNDSGQIAFSGDGWCKRTHRNRRRGLGGRGDFCEYSMVGIAERLRSDFSLVAFRRIEKSGGGGRCR